MKEIVILVVEDIRDRMQDLCQPVINHFKENDQVTVRFRWAKSIEMADYLIACSRELNFDIVVMDACIPGEKTNTQPLIKKLLERSFAGEIVTFSNDQKCNQELMDAGATIKSNKKEAATVIIELINKLLFGSN